MILLILLLAKTAVCDPTEEKLLKDIGSKDPETRIPAAMEIGRLSRTLKISDATLQTLMTMLVSKDIYQQEGAALAFGEIRVVDDATLSFIKQQAEKEQKARPINYNVSIALVHTLREITECRALMALAGEKSI